jgi:hypothetical protein
VSARLNAAALVCIEIGKLVNSVSEWQLLKD